MTVAKDFATQVGALAVGGTAFALGDPSGGTLLATPITALAALGLTLKTGCAERACAKAEQTVLKLLGDNPEYSDEQIARAKTILTEAPNVAQLDPKEVTVHVHGKDLEAELARLIMRPLGIGADDTGVHDIIQTALVASIAICKQDTEFRAALTLELVLETARKQGIEIKALERIEGKVDDLSGMLKALLAGDYVPLADMKLLAAEFGAHEVEDQASLERFLKLKAEEFVALKAEVDAIDDGLKRLSNLKAAAQDAIARVDLDEVEELLSRVQEVELEEAAKTAELRAENALLRGKVEQAYRIFSAAADSFASVDPLELARRKTLNYAERLARHGMRFGGTGLPLSVQLTREVATDNLRAQHAWLWAAGKNVEAIGLQNQGIRTDGQAGAELLAEAVDAHRAALEVTTRAEHPVDWATTQNNLGNALAEQGSRTDGEVSTNLLAQAVATYSAALEVRTRADYPVQWASTQNNLGTALQEQGKRTDGPPGVDLLAEAVVAYRAALEVRTCADHPVDWAMTQANIAIALLDRSARPDADDPKVDLQAALTAVQAAMEVYDPEHMSYDHAWASRVRDNILAAMAG